MNNFTFGGRSRDNLSSIKFTMKKVCILALRYSTVDFTVIDGMRTTEEQQKLFKAGATELDGVHKKSAHQSGEAVDIIPVVPGRNVWDVEDPVVAAAWLEVGRAMLRAGMKCNENIEWGIAYDIGGGRDYPHFQIKR